jgi:hypothetical protein
MHPNSPADILCSLFFCCQQRLLLSLPPGPVSLLLHRLLMRGILFQCMLHHTHTHIVMQQSNAANVYSQIQTTTIAETVLNCC